jgi:hypothetical protein
LDRAREETWSSPSHSFGSVRGDVTDYRAFGLSPGVKVVGEKMATSSGIVMQNGQLRRLSLALHRFEDTDDVFHPDPLPQFHLGTIDIRIPWIDVALCVMDERVTFTNKSYFLPTPTQDILQCPNTPSYILQPFFTPALPLVM